MSIEAQVDIGNLSLAGLGAFTTILTALSADDVQPLAMVQLQNLGAVFPISGPIADKVPDHLHGFHSTRLERLGVLVGWPKGDSASLMAQTTGGQAIALLSVCLTTVFVARGSLGRRPRFLSYNLAVIAFGTILAKEVVRIHEAYKQLQMKSPNLILESLSGDWMAEMLAKISQALQQERGHSRIRGCYGMGYVFGLMVTLFAADCIITVEGLIVHQGDHADAIVIDVVTECGDKPLEVQLMDKIESMSEILDVTGNLNSQHDLAIRSSDSIIHAHFEWQGHLSAYLHVQLQQWGIVCSPAVVRAVGICALAASDMLSIEVGKFKVPLVSILGEQPHSILKKDKMGWWQCEQPDGQGPFIAKEGHLLS
ncbi:hypothetical protein BDW59DRAFT_165719 [Aspergillus cavernicola]|uniref:Uncharacterized protein n=1 Tax=Aspergillus cavernicola TaxID=176166 RepID=A0ABR4HQY1_9EURO